MQFFCNANSKCKGFISTRQEENCYIDKKCASIKSVKKTENFENKQTEEIVQKKLQQNEFTNESIKLRSSSGQHSRIKEMGPCKYTKKEMF